MAINITRPVAPIASSANVTSYATASFTPTANAFLVVLVFATATTATGSVMGFGLNWYKYNSGAISGSTLYIFWAKTGASVSADVVTFDCTGDAATGCFIVVHEATGDDQFTRIPIRQSVFNAASSTNANGTFASALDTNNGYIAAYAGGLTAGVSTVPTGWTQSSDGDISNPTANFFSARRSTGESGSTVTFTNPSTGWLFVGVEIYADGLGPRPALAALGCG